MINRRTKIIATLGPASDDPGVMRELIASGVDVARFNFSHGSHGETKKRLELFRRICSELGANVAALADTKGPEIRLGVFKGGSAELVAGSIFKLTTEECEGTAERAHVTYAKLPGVVSQGVKILIDDGLLDVEVTGASDTEITTIVKHGGRVSNHKSINIPSVRLDLPFISNADRADLRLMAELGFDYIAASFTRSADDIRALREALRPLWGARKGAAPLIIAKIENAEGVENLEAILDAADGLMIARGDLGVELPLKEIPIIQKKMINRANSLGKAVITATQMLESMVHNPRPTRAEVSDVANAVYDGTGALMLSGETAGGAYPVEAVKAMSDIAAYTERTIDYKEHFQSHGYNSKLSIVNAISHAVVTTAHDLDAAAILTVTISGATARNVAKYMPSCPIIACSSNPTVVRQLCLVWGVKPYLMDEQCETSALFLQAAGIAASKAGLSNGDLVVIAAGVPLATVGATNLIKVHEIGENTSII